MSDMTDTKLANTEESQVSTQTTQTTESKEAPKTTEEVFTKAQLDEMLNKVRREEKDKLYKSIEKTKAQAESVQAERDKVLEDLKLAKEKLSTIQDSNMSDIEKVNKQIELLAEQNELLKNQLENVSKQAEQRVKESEVKSYKQKQIEKSGLLFPEMVSGNTPEEIDASISMLKEREKSVRQELEDRLRSERAQDVPRPMSPEMNQTQVASADRYRVSKMSRDEYQAYRQKLMAQAMDAVRR
jgi:serine phosphatase RsbU (regulator of sigma subunit)